MDSITKTLASLFLVSFLSSCQIGYLIKSGYSHLAMLNQKIPISQALQSEKLTEEQKRKILLTQEVRKYAFTKLGFKETKNYTDFVDLGRPYVTYTVMASKKWEFKPHLWNFPIIGKAPYKGFYNEIDAETEADEFKNKDYDTYVRGVTAFSTLGKMNDPLLSSMLAYSDHVLVNTIFHELVHTTLFIKDNIDFNERLAVFVANQATELFYLEKEGAHSNTVKLIQDENEDEKKFSGFITKEIDLLKGWYQQVSEKNKAEEIRQARFDQIKDSFKKNLQSQLKTKLYGKFSEQKLNNARLSLYNTYMKDLSDFENVYRKTGDSIPLFLEKLKTLNKVDDPEAELKIWATAQ